MFRSVLMTCRLNWKILSVKISQTRKVFYIAISLNAMTCFLSATVDSELESEAEVNIPQVTPLSSRSKRAQCNRPNIDLVDFDNQILVASKAKAQHGLKLPEPSHKSICTIYAYSSKS